MVIPLQRINLSEPAKEILNSIYQQYVIHKEQQSSDSYNSRIFSGHFLFSSSDNSYVMPSLVELSSKQMIRFFSDKRIMISNQAISYIEQKQAKKNDTKL